MRLFAQNMILCTAAALACCLVFPVFAQNAESPETDVQAQQPLFSVTLDMAEEAVARAMEARQGGAEQGSVQVRLFGNRNAPLYSGDKPLELAVKTLTPDESAKKLSASLLIQSRGEVLTALPVTGRYDTMVLLPVLKVRVLPGEPIRDEQVTMQRFGSHAVRDSTVTETSALIGRTPKRGISAGRPVRAYELANAASIRKGEGVTLHFTTGSLSITAQGEALEDGAIGDNIRVRNTDSSRIVRGLVEEGRNIRVAAGATTAPKEGIAMRGPKNNANNSSPSAGSADSDRTIEDLYSPDEDWYNDKK